MVNDFRANWSRNTAAQTTVLDGFHGAVPPPDSAMYPPGYTSQTSQFVFIPPLPLDTDAEVRSGPLNANVQKQLNFIDNFSLTARAHQLKFGADFRHLNPSTDTNRYDLLIQAKSYAGLQAGTVDSVFTTRGSQITTAISNYSFFAQDIWKASLRLTLTYGLRWEINTPLRSITPGKPLYAMRGVFDSAQVGFLPAGTPLWHTRFDNLAPRFGATFQLAPQTVLRGGFGRYYDLGFGGNIAGTMVYFPYMAASLVLGPIPFDFSSAAFQAPPLTLVPSSATAYTSCGRSQLESPVHLRMERSYSARAGRKSVYFGYLCRRARRQSSAWGQDHIARRLRNPDDPQLRLV